MGRTTSVAPAKLNDDEPYIGVLVSAKVVPSKTEGWADQLEVDFELRQGGAQRDWLPLNLTTKAGTPSKLRQLLNAIAEQPKDTACWWDPDTLEWGYDVDTADSAAYAQVNKCVGMMVQFRGENRKNKVGVMRYNIAAYKMAPGTNRKPKPEAPLEVVDVDPDEISF